MNGTPGGVFYDAAGLSGWALPARTTRRPGHIRHRRGERHLRYNGLGRRITSTLAGTSKRYVVDQTLLLQTLHNVLTETDTAGTARRHYVRLRTACADRRQR